jgi:hypothetical protein
MLSLVVPPEPPQGSILIDANSVVRVRATLGWPGIGEGYITGPPSWGAVLLRGPVRVLWRPDVTPALIDTAVTLLELVDDPPQSVARAHAVNRLRELVNLLKPGPLDAD